MEPVVFRYRSRDLGPQDIDFIQGIVAQSYEKGRSHISRALCEAWGWVQPNGKLKEYAARDLLLRLEEKGFFELPPACDLRITSNGTPLFRLRCSVRPLWKESSASMASFPCG